MQSYNVSQTSWFFCVVYSTIINVRIKAHDIDNAEGLFVLHQNSHNVVRPRNGVIPFF